MHSGHYWIINAKLVIKRVLSQCIPCKIENMKPSNQLMGQLPNERTAVFDPVFTNTGVDYFGPILVKNSKRIRFTSGYNKHYGVVLTCLTTRATHLELAGDLSTDLFIPALKRFIARRGQPKVMYSDNGSNFRGAEKELGDLFSKIDFDKVSKTLTNYNINWKFIPPLSPWMGGAWESIVKLTKRALRIVTHDRPMYEDSLSTFITEIESVLNSRPLTSVTDDPNDYKVLTPNHFLLGRQTLPFTLNDEKAFNRVCWRAVEALSNMFWKRFIQEYLPMLNIRKKWNREKRDFKENDLVIMKNEHQHRSL